MIMRTANILGIYFVFKTSFSKSIFEMIKLNTTNVKPKPKTYSNILTAAYALFDATSNVIREIR